MNEDFVSYDLAVKLKELGFDWECYEFWDTSFCDDGTPVKTRHTHGGHNFKVCVMRECNSVLESMGSELITAPTMAKAQKWLREAHNLHIRVDTIYARSWFYQLCPIGGASEEGGVGFPSYEAALSAGIEAALKLLTDKTNEL